MESATTEPGQLPLRPRPPLQAVSGSQRTTGDSGPKNGTPGPGGEPLVDLTAEDDTQALPRLDSLERKLKDLEQQFG